MNETDAGIEGFKSSLFELTVNNRALISMLTMLAEENVQNASIIVQSIEAHIQQVYIPIRII